MEINLFIILAIIIVAVSAVLGLIAVFNKLKLSGKKLTSVESLLALTAVALPAVRVGFDIAMAERKADSGGFDAVKAATIAYVLSILEDSGYNQLNSEELDHVLQQCEPILEYLWKYKIEVPNKNIHPQALREIRATLKAE